MRERLSKLVENWRRTSAAYADAATPETSEHARISLVAVAEMCAKMASDLAAALDDSAGGDFLSELASVGIEPDEDEDGWTYATEPLGPQPVATLSEAVRKLCDAAYNDGLRARLTTGDA